MGATAWIYWLCGGAATAAGLALLAWALLRDRSRGRRRCPRCWYDMAGAPTLTCPECGRDARTEKRLFKTRRRWRWAAVGLVALSLGVGTLAYPLFSERGLYGFVPTEFLILMAPDAGAEGSATSRQAAAAKEILHRIDMHHLTGWQWSMLLRQTNVVRHRRAWPRGRPLLVDVSCPAWLEGVAALAPAPPLVGNRLNLGSGSFRGVSVMVPESRLLRLYDASGESPLPPASEITAPSSPFGTTPSPRRRLELGTSEGNRATIRLDIDVRGGSAVTAGKPLWSGVLATVRLVDDPALAIPPCDAAIAAAVAPLVRCIVRVRDPDLFLNDPMAEIGVQIERLPQEIADHVAFGLRVELLRDGEPLEEIEMLLTPGPLACLHGPYLEGEIVSCLRPLSVHAAASAVEIDAAEIARWSVRITGDPMIAVDDLPKSTHWHGTLTLPLADVYVPVTPTKLFDRGSNESR